MKRLILASLLFATPALAQQAAQEMVLIPRTVAEAALEQIHHPNLMNNIDVYAAMAACISDNPHDGRTTRMGQDQCSVVTDAIAARDKQIADLTKERDAAKSSAAPSSATQTGSDHQASSTPEPAK